jgi:5-methyltetrahydrofolate--homocysteine methyltransferase
LRERLGLDPKAGTRWSPGYPGLVNMENNKFIHDILDAGSQLGVKITEVGEFHPTGCTAAVVSFHPDARYS